MVDAADVGPSLQWGSAMTDPDDPEFAHQLGEASVRVQALHADLLAAVTTLATATLP